MATTEPYIEYYTDDAGEWRWHLKAANHRIISDSSEGYVELRKAKHGFAVFAKAVGGDPANIREVIKS